MPNGLDYDKKYGPHKYEDHGGISDCKHGCGCSTGPATSDGPVGLNPLSGECPRNPKNGNLIGGNSDYEIVVTRRIMALESKLFEARERVDKAEKIAGSDKTKLFNELEVTKIELKTAVAGIKEIAEIVRKKVKQNQ